MNDWRTLSVENRDATLASQLTACRVPHSASTCRILGSRAVVKDNFDAFCSTNKSVARGQSHGLRNKGQGFDSRRRQRAGIARDSGSRHSGARVRSPRSPLTIIARVSVFTWLWFCSLVPATMAGSEYWFPVLCRIYCACVCVMRGFMCSK